MMINDDTKGNDIMAKNTKPAPETTDEVEAEEPTTITAKELASRCGTDPKAFRRWLRRQTDNRAGKGGRWTFDADEADRLVEAFNKTEAEVTEEVPAD